MGEAHGYLMSIREGVFCDLQFSSWGLYFSGSGKTQSMGEETEMGVTL